MTVTTGTDVYYDMYDRDIYASPYETYRRLRDEAVLADARQRAARWSWAPARHCGLASRGASSARPTSGYRRTRPTSPTTYALTENAQDAD
jgi:hypothetical protein